MQRYHPQTERTTIDQVAAAAIAYADARRHTATQVDKAGRPAPAWKVNVSDEDWACLWQAEDVLLSLIDRLPGDVRQALPEIPPDGRRR